MDENNSVEPPVEPFLDGHYELSPLLSKTVEAELQDVMIKVWQLLPDDPRDEAEKLVVERFRNKAGDDLRNTLGLNVTKRLLNVHNPLYVKMVFSSKPIRADLVKFIKKYNISAFKSVGMRGGTFAAKMRSFQDFDNLCTEKNLKCGRVRVTVTPCYQFMKCPPNLKTCYDGNEQSTMNKHNEKNIFKGKPVAAKQQAESEEGTTSAQQHLADKQNTPKVTPTKTTESAPSKVAPKVTPAKPNAPTEIKEVAAKVTSTKPNPAATENQSPASKATPAESNQDATQAQNAAPKVTPAATQSPNTAQKATPSKPATANAQNTAPKGKPTKPAAGPKEKNAVPKASPSTSATTNNQNTVPKVTPAPKPVNNPKSAQSSQPATAKNPKVTASKAVGQKATPKATKPKQISPKKKPENDYDELDDHDILALISGGIVLDECSGSEED